MDSLKIVNQDLRFDPVEHKYFHQGREMISVTTLLGRYKKPFDADGSIALRCAQRRGISVEQILAEWKQAKDDGLRNGKEFHDKAEQFIKFNRAYEGKWSDIVEKLNQFEFNRALVCELPLRSKKYPIAGTTDLVEFEGKDFWIYDFKTNKRFDRQSRFGNKLLPPVYHLEECELTLYSLQIWLYGLMLEEYGYNFKGGKILHINRQMREIDVYSILNLRKEVIDIAENHMSTSKNMADYRSKLEQWFRKKYRIDDTPNYQGKPLEPEPMPAQFALADDEWTKKIRADVERKTKPFKPVPLDKPKFKMPMRENV